MERNGNGEHIQPLSSLKSYLSPMVLQADKQFYLDQAKQLKETFNMKYPDYVYRRRPNNTRKKRRTDLGGNRAVDHSVGGGDESGSTEFDDTSPVDEDLFIEAALPDPRQAHMPADMSPYDMPHPRASPYTYSPPDVPYRQSHGRAPYPPSGQQRGNPDASNMPPRHPQTLGSTHHYQQPYIQPHQNHSDSSHLYSSEHDNAHRTWDAASSVGRSGHARTTPADWPNSQDRPLAGLPHDRSQTYPPASGQSSWGRTNSPVPTRSTSASASYPFATLTTPFYPNPSQASGTYSNTTPPSSSISSSNQQYHTSSSGPVSGNSGRPSSGYEHRSYNSSSSSNPYPSTSNRDLHMYQQHSQHPHTHTPSASASSGSGPSNFWPRDKNDGQ